MMWFAYRIIIDRVLKIYAHFMRKSLKSFQKDVIADGDFLKIYQVSQLENEIKL